MKAETVPLLGARVSVKVIASPSASFTTIRDPIEVAWSVTIAAAVAVGRSFTGVIVIDTVPVVALPPASVARTVNVSTPVAFEEGR